MAEDGLEGIAQSRQDCNLKVVGVFAAFQSRWACRVADCPHFPREPYPLTQKRRLADHNCAHQDQAQDQNHGDRRGGEPRDRCAIAILHRFSPFAGCETGTSLLAPCSAHSRLCAALRRGTCAESRAFGSGRRGTFRALPRQLMKGTSHGQPESEPE